MAAAPSHPDIALLYSDHHGWLVGWLRRRLGNPCDAADLAQDTFVRVLGKPQSLHGGREPAIGHELVLRADQLLEEHARDMPGAAHP